jgi:phage shock protein C
METNRRLKRSEDAWIAGVCGGIAEYFDFDKGAVRLIWLLLSIFTAGFPGFILYLILWILMPKY